MTRVATTKDNGAATCGVVSGRSVVALTKNQKKFRVQVGINRSEVSSRKTRRVFPAARLQITCKIY